MMKHIRILVLMVSCSLLMAGCVSRRAGHAESEWRGEVQHLLIDSLRAGTFVMDADYMYPQRVSAQGLTAGYAVQVAGGQVRSILPYRGRAFRSSMEMGRNGPLHFDSKVFRYMACRERKGQWMVDFDALNGQERLHYAFRFSANGRVRLKVSSSDRDWIVFEGWLREN